MKSRNEGIINIFRWIQIFDDGEKIVLGKNYDIWNMFYETLFIYPNYLFIDSKFAFYTGNSNTSFKF